MSSLILVIVCRGLNFIHPIPLAACHFDRHCSSDSLLESVDCCEGRNDKPKNDHRRNVEEKVLRFHQQFVIAIDSQTLSWPKGGWSLNEGAMLDRMHRRNVGHWWVR